MTSILDHLSNKNVFRIEKNSDGAFRVTENCDYWYGVDLTKEQMLQLAEEIKALAES